MKRCYLLMCVLFLTGYCYANAYHEKALEYKAEGKYFSSLATMYDGMEIFTEDEEMKADYDSLVELIETGTFGETDSDDSVLHDKWQLFLQDLEVYFCKDLPVAIKIGDFSKSKLSYDPRESMYKVKIGTVQTEKFKKLLGEIVYPAYEKVRKTTWSDLPEIRKTCGGLTPEEYRYIGTAFLNNIGHYVSGDDDYYVIFDYKTFYEENNVFLASYNKRNYAKNTNEYHNPSPVWGENLATRVNFIVTYDLVDANDNVLFNGVSELTAEYPCFKEAYSISFTADQDFAQVLDNGGVQIVVRKLKMFYGFYDSNSDQTKLKRPLFTSIQI